RTTIKDEFNVNETKTNDKNTKFNNNNTAQYTEQPNSATNNSNNNDAAEGNVEQGTNTVQEPSCPVCGSKYHAVHPQNQAPDIPMNFD
ncbi:MAG: hypothetical protein ACI4DS_01900, partial [Eubacterium sp.]